MRTCRNDLLQPAALLKHVYRSLEANVPARERAAKEHGISDLSVIATDSALYHAGVQQASRQSEVRKVKDGAGSRWRRRG